MPKTTPRLILAGIAAASMATAASAQSDEQTQKPKVIHVDPVRSADEAHTVLEKERGNLPKSELTIGMKAPDLAIAKWVKGDSVRQFEEDQAYVVEFWATWCGPCVRAFPHVSELQKKHGENLTVIGVNIWDRKQNRETGEFTEPMPEFVERITGFVKEQDERMGYTVAIEESGKMAKTWMAAAGQNGIPAAFIVDGAGKIAWMGHPGEMDEPLDQVLDGNWDYEMAAKVQAAERENGYWYRHLMTLLGDEATSERGYRLGYALLRSPFANEHGILNAVSWNVLTSDRIAARDLDLAIAFASVACEKTDWQDASIIDTLARGYFDKGEVAKAIELQTNAVKLAEGERMVNDLKNTLMQYKNHAND